MTDKLKRLGTALKRVNEKYKGKLILGSEFSEVKLLETPFVTLNSIVGGIPLGKFSTIAGAEHTGKGAFCMQLIAHHQQRDPDFIALWTDAENALDLEWAKILGVDLNRLVVNTYTKEVDTMEKILDESLSLIKDSESINLWVIDSIGALLPHDDIEDSKDKEKSLEGRKMLNLQTKIGEFYRKANPLISRTGTAVILIGQVYTVPEANVSLEEVRGGNSVKHWAHLRLRFRRGPRSSWPDEVEYVGADGNKYKLRPGWSGRIKVDKTRINENEGKEILLTFMNGRGFDSEEAVLTAAFGLNIFERSGPMYSCDLLPEGKVKGRENVLKYFRENKEAFAALEKRINERSLISHIENNQLTKENENVEYPI